MDSSEKKQLFLAANRIRQHIIEGTRADTRADRFRLLT